AASSTAADAGPLSPGRRPRGGRPSSLPAGVEAVSAASAFPRWFCPAALLGAALLAAGCGADSSGCRHGEARTRAVEVRASSFKELTGAIASHRGKVVVVDVWGTFCRPCKEEFHNLVEIHGEHAAGGVVCMSAAIDPSENEAALAFLKSKGAAF